MPGENIHDWSTTATDNDDADSLINWREGMARAAVNDSGRSLMAAHAKNRNLQNGTIVTAGTANAQTFTSGVGYTGTVPTGMRVLLKIGASLTNTGPTTLNMDGIGDITIKDQFGEDLQAGQLVAGGYNEFIYDGTNWRTPQQDPLVTTIINEIINPPPPPGGGDPIGVPAIPILIETSPPITTPVASVDFIVGIDDTYDQYTMVMSNVVPSTNHANLSMLVSTDAGVTWASSYYYSQNALLNGINIATAAAGAAAMIMAFDLTNIPQGVCNGEMKFYTPKLLKYCPMTWSLGYNDGVGSAGVLATGMGFKAGAFTGFNAVRILMSTGTIASGTFALYGTRK